MEKRPCFHQLLPPFVANNTPKTLCYKSKPIPHIVRCFRICGAITTLILQGNSANNQPYVKASIKKTHHGHPSAYPLTNRRRSIAVSSVLRPPLPISDDTTDADVDYEVKLLAPITNRLSRYGGRATSVPPQSVTLTYHPLLTKHSVLYRDGLAYDHHARPILVTADDAGYYHQTPSIYELHLQVV